MAKAVLKKGEGRSLKAGGPWIYDNEISHIEGDFENGDIINVRDFDGFDMGYGFVNTNSKLTVRMLSRHTDRIDDDFFRARVSDAWELRKKVTDTSSCRVIFGEADFLPGLVVDKYEDVLVVESLCLGMDRYKDLVIDELKKIIAADGTHIRGVYERSDSQLRKKEGMEPFRGFIGGEFDTDVLINENGIRYYVDVKDGQKTGFFLDQKNNRLAVRSISRDMKVLDCFTHTGAFALNAAFGGARAVTAVDISGAALARARRNAALNGFSGIRFEEADVFDYLTAAAERGDSFDAVILDPPAFTKSKDATKKAVKGYRDLNTRGLRLVRDGGFLATCSCSRFMTEELFKKTLSEAARAARRRLRQVYFAAQSPDHPILWSADQSYYLKFFIFNVLKER